VTTTSSAQPTTIESTLPPIMDSTPAIASADDEINYGENFPKLFRLIKTNGLNGKSQIKSD